MLQISITAAKKLPHPTHQFGSISAQVSLVGEAGTLADAPAIMRDLFATAQAGCDQHLAQQSGTTPPMVAQATPASVQPMPINQPHSVPSSHPRPSASQPYRSGGQRRGPAPVTDSQLRFLTRLIDQTKASLPAILDHHQVGGLDQLSCKDAAGLIDELKARVPA